MELPGVLRRLRGEWPCVPFGRTDLPTDLPEGWAALSPDDDWPHGYGSNHIWDCVSAEAHLVQLSIEYPTSAPIKRVERRIRVVPGAAALDIELVVQPRRTVILPVGLHPTFKLPQPDGRVRVELGPHQGIFTYPSRSAGAATLLHPDQRANRLETMPGVDGPLDLSMLPLKTNSEELLQVRGLSADGDAAPLCLHYLDHDARVDLTWDTKKLPDLMLWLSNRGRPEFPWEGQHVALGAEPVNSVFDLGRVAKPPISHPLADRVGVRLTADQPWSTRYRIAAHSTSPLR